MSRVSNILDRARDSLGDPDKKRFSDAQLLRLLSEAQEQAALVSKALVQRTIMQLVPGTSYLALPEDCSAVLRVDYNGVKLQFKSFEEMDLIDSNWAARTGTVPQYVVYDLRQPNTIALWPSLIYPELEPYGLVTSLGSSTIATAQGSANSIPGSVVIGEETYGIIATIDVQTYSVRVYYAKRPIDVTSLASTIELPQAFDTALKHYVVGFALRDNMDTQNRAVAQEALAQAAAAMQVAIRLTGADFARADYSTTYNKGV